MAARECQDKPQSITKCKIDTNRKRPKNKCTSNGKRVVCIIMGGMHRNPWKMHGGRAAAHTLGIERAMLCVVCVTRALCLL
jgi:hypothetical protein